jgi:hypothetical protein
MPTKLDTALNQLLTAIARQLAARLSTQVGQSRRNGIGQEARRPSKLAGRKLDMRCRHPGCRSRSKGPRFSFLCEEHLKVPKKRLKAEVEKAEARKLA